VREEVRWWLNTAQGDLDSAVALRDIGQFATAAFHCQQAAEKFLKALVVAQGGHLRTHSCLDLALNLKESGLEIDEAVVSGCRTLDRQYIQSRYPNGLGGDPTKYYDRKFVEELIECVQTIRELVERNL
jgi:HEPN domain-containing protein